jgi:hypothetical protein
MPLSQAALIAEIEALIVDNNTGLVTPAILRQVLEDMVNNLQGGTGGGTGGSSLDFSLASNSANIAIVVA